MSKLFTQIRWLTILFIIALVINGITTFPLYTEIKLILDSNMFEDGSLIQQWLLKVVTAIKEIQENYPFIFYGFDWLAFAHLIIAILFIGVYQHPVRNRWIIQWGIITCICVVPFAFIAGTARGIPFFQILIDASFGLIGLIPLFIISNKVNKLKSYRSKSRSDNDA